MGGPGRSRGMMAGVPAAAFRRIAARSVAVAVLAGLPGVGVGWGGGVAGRDDGPAGRPGSVGTAVARAGVGGGAVARASGGVPAGGPAVFAGQAAAAAAEGDRPAVARYATKRWIRHRVVPRERLAGIAARYRVREASLRRWNPEVGDEPEAGDVLRVYTDFVPPPRRLRTVTVQPDDTWTRLARRHGIGSWDLRAMNYRPGGRLRPGEPLRVWVDPIQQAAIDAEWDDPPLGVRPGAHGVGSPDDGRLVAGVQLPERPAYIRKIPGSAYGTTHTIRTLVRALETFRRDTGFGGRIYVGAISRPRGGRLGGHRSHQTGRDVDIRLPLRTSIPQALEPIPARRVDFVALYGLVRALVDTGEVVVLFLDYPLQRRLARAAKSVGATDEELAVLLQWPRGRKASRGIVRDSPGHDDHIHVRFRCGPSETECRGLDPEGWGDLPVRDVIAAHDPRGAVKTRPCAACGRSERGVGSASAAASPRRARPVARSRAGTP